MQLVVNYEVSLSEKTRVKGSSFWLVFTAFASKNNPLDICTTSHMNPQCVSARYLYVKEENLLTNLYHYVNVYVYTLISGWKCIMIAIAARS